MWSNPNNPITKLFKRLKWGFHRLSKVWLTIDDSIKISNVNSTIFSHLPNTFLVGTSGNSTKGCNFSSLSYWKKSLDFCVWQVRVCSNNGVKGAWSGLGFYWSKPPKQMKALFIEGGSWYRSRGEKLLCSLLYCCCCCFSFGLKVVVEMLGAHDYHTPAAASNSLSGLSLISETCLKIWATSAQSTLVILWNFSVFFLSPWKFRKQWTTKRLLKWLAYLDQWWCTSRSPPFMTLILTIADTHCSRP